MNKKLFFAGLVEGMISSALVEFCLSYGRQAIDNIFFGTLLIVLALLLAVDILVHKVFSLKPMFEYRSAIDFDYKPLPFCSWIAFTGFVVGMTISVISILVIFKP